MATVDGAMQQHQQGPGTGTTIHSSDTLALDAPSPAPPDGGGGGGGNVGGGGGGAQQPQQQYRQSGSHMSGMSEKAEVKTDAAKEKERESYEDRLERSVSGLSGRVTSMPEGVVGVTIPHDPQCGCIAPIPPFPTTAK